MTDFCYDHFSTCNIMLVYLVIVWHSGFSSPSVILISLSELESVSFDYAVTITMANASSNVCSTTYVTTSLIVSANPYQVCFS